MCTRKNEVTEAKQKQHPVVDVTGDGSKVWCCKEQYCMGTWNVRSISSVQSLSRIRFFAIPWTAARQASLSLTNSRSLLKFMSIESVMPSNHLILCHPFSSHLQSFPASGSFPMSQFFTSGGQSIGASASASVLPMNIQDWFPLGWTRQISLLSKELSRVSPTPQFKNINSSAFSFLYSPTLTSIRDMGISWIIEIQRKPRK